MNETASGAPVSESVRRLPAAPLRSFVAWYSGYRQDGVPPAIHRGLPSPYLTMIVTLDDPLTVAGHPNPKQRPGDYQALIGGLHSTPALIVHSGRQSGIQVALSPLGARALLRLPAGELAGIDLHATDVLGRVASELHERVRRAGSWDERFRVMDEVLLQLLDLDRAPPAQVSHAWRLLLSSRGAASVRSLSARVGWSSRHLSQQFQAEIGLGPKVAARVTRFDRARRLLQSAAARAAPPGLAGLAAAAGYFDQAHLAREFRDFAGLPPSRWLREEFRNVQGDAPGPMAEWPHE